MEKMPENIQINKNGILITAALYFEISFFLNKKKKVCLWKEKNCSLFQVKSLSGDFYAGITGIGPDGVHRFLKCPFLKKIGFGAIISTGLAGAMQKELHPGMLVTADKIYYAEKVFPAEPYKNPGNTKFIFCVTSGYTSPVVLCARDKLLIRRQIPAGFVDMESGVLAAWAEKENKVFFVTRVISDGLYDFIPDHKFFPVKKKIKIIAAVLLHPVKFYKSLLFALKCRYARSILCSFLDMVITANPEKILLPD
ncbi:MAG TPA: hypothetical protein DC049_20495 [Spirochaetia bacterium]|nr:hypothetical protein [Spirochaetia bacterium]